GLSRVRWEAGVQTRDGAEQAAQLLRQRQALCFRMVPESLERLAELRPRLLAGQKLSPAGLQRFDEFLCETEVAALRQLFHLLEGDGGVALRVEHDVHGGQESPNWRLGVGLIDLLEQLD